MARGMIGWTKIGCYDLPDGRATIKISGNTGTLIVSAIRLVEGEISDEEEAGEMEISESNIPNLGDDVVVLKVGNTKAYKGGKTYTLDAAAKITADRTFVPVRFIAEAIGASVEWNDGTKEANVTLGDKELVFKVGSDEYLSNNENKKLDAYVFISNDRTMLPVRAISEEFDREVLWDESGVIVILPQKVSEQDKNDALNKALNIFK